MSASSLDKSSIMKHYRQNYSAYTMTPVYMTTDFILPGLYKPLFYEILEKLMMI